MFVDHRPGENFADDENRDDYEPGGDHDFNCECRKYYKVKVLVVVVILLNCICR